MDAVVGEPQEQVADGPEAAVLPAVGEGQGREPLRLRHRGFRGAAELEPHQPAGQAERRSSRLQQGKWRGKGQAQLLRQLPGGKLPGPGAGPGVEPVPEKIDVTGIGKARQPQLPGLRRRGDGGEKPVGSLAPGVGIAGAYNGFHGLACFRGNFPLIIAESPGNLYGRSYFYKHNRGGKTVRWIFADILPVYRKNLGRM